MSDNNTHNFGVRQSKKIIVNITRLNRKCKIQDGGHKTGNYDRICGMCLVVGTLDPITNVQTCVSACVNQNVLCEFVMPYVQHIIVNSFNQMFV